MEEVNTALVGSDEPLNKPVNALLSVVVLSMELINSANGIACEVEPLGNVAFPSHDQQVLTTTTFLFHTRFQEPQPVILGLRMP